MVFNVFFENKKIALQKSFTEHFLTFPEQNAAIVVMEQNVNRKEDGRNGVCRICSDRVGCGLNFGCLSCESCKAFFRRCCANANNNKTDNKQQLVCPFIGKCQITKASRKACPACRLAKCMQAGMRPEMVDAWKKQWTTTLARNETLNKNGWKRTRKRVRKILVEEEAADETAMKYRKHDGNNNNGENVPERLSNQKTIGTSKCVCKCRCGAMKEQSAEKGIQTEERHVPEENNNIGACYTLTGTEQALLDELMRANIVLEMPLRVPPQFLVFNLTLMDALRVSELAMRRMVAMCKQLGAFRRLDQRDQVTLLRTSLVELLILRGAMAFDASNEEWRAAIMSAAAGADSRPHPFCLNLSVLPATERHSKEHKRFLMTFDQRWRTNRAVMLILHAIVLFTPRADGTLLIGKQQVDGVRDKYCQLLRKCLLRENGDIVDVNNPAYTHLMDKLSELRQLNASFQWLYSRLNNHSELEPLLLKELFSTNNNNAASSSSAASSQSACNNSS